MYDWDEKKIKLMTEPIERFTKISIVDNFSFWFIDSTTNQWFSIRNHLRWIDFIFTEDTLSFSKPSKSETRTEQNRELYTISHSANFTQKNLILFRKLFVHICRLFVSVKCHDFFYEAHKYWSYPTKKWTKTTKKVSFLWFWYSYIAKIKWMKANRNLKILPLKLIHLLLLLKL